MPERARPMDRPPAYDIACGDIRKNARERIRVSLHEFNGTDCVSLRVWFDPGNAHRPDEMRPSAKGLTVATRLIPEILAALTEADRQAREAGLLPTADDAAGRGT